MGITSGSATPGAGPLHQARETDTASEQMAGCVSGNQRKTWSLGMGGMKLPREKLPTSMACFIHSFSQSVIHSLGAVMGTVGLLMVFKKVGLSKPPNSSVGLEWMLKFFGRGRRAEFR